jgi:predicted kinase
MKRVILSQPTLLLVMGVAASGKTTLSRKILERLHLVYLDNNFVADAFSPDTRNDAGYLKLRPHFYEILYRITKENLSIGNSVLLDVPHVKEMRDVRWQTLITDLVRITKAKLVVIRCLCSEDTLKKRIVSRGEERDAWKLANWHEFLKEQPIDVFIPFEHLDINTDDNVAAIEPAIKYIFEKRF